MAQLMRANPEVLLTAPIKAVRRLDSFLVDLDATTEAIIDATRYWCGLFSHRRGDDLWKGMVKVSLDPAEDDIALLSLAEPPLREEHQDAEITAQDEPQ